MTGVQTCALPISQAGALPASALDSVIEQAKALDMDKVRAEIAQSEAQSGAGS